MQWTPYLVLTIYLVCQRSSCQSNGQLAPSVDSAPPSRTSLLRCCLVLTPTAVRKLMFKVTVALNSEASIPCKAAVPSGFIFTYDTLRSGKDRSHAVHAYKAVVNQLRFLVEENVTANKILRKLTLESSMTLFQYVSFSLHIFHTHLQERYR